MASGRSRARRPSALAYLNPFLAQADVAVRHRGPVRRLDRRAHAQLLQVPSSVRARRADTGAGASAIGDDSGGGRRSTPGSSPDDVDRAGPAGATAAAVGVADRRAVAVVVRPRRRRRRSGSPRDAFWPKSVVAWLVLSVVFLLLSVQFVSPTRRWRLRAVRQRQPRTPPDAHPRRARAVGSPRGPAGRRPSSRPIPRAVADRAARSRPARPSERPAPAPPPPVAPAARPARLDRARGRRRRRARALDRRPVRPARVGAGRRRRDPGRRPPRLARGRRAGAARGSARRRWPSTPRVGLGDRVSSALELAVGVPGARPGRRRRTTTATPIRRRSTRPPRPIGSSAASARDALALAPASAPPACSGRGSRAGRPAVALRRGAPARARRRCCRTRRTPSSPSSSRSARPPSDRPSGSTSRRGPRDARAQDAERSADAARPGAARPRAPAARATRTTSTRTSPGSERSRPTSAPRSTRRTSSGPRR